MNTITLANHYPGEWAGKFVTEKDYDVLLEEDTKVLRPDGSTLLVLRKKALPIDLVAQAWGVIKGINLQTNNRGIASGQKIKKQRLKKDGTISNQQTTAEPINSSILGYFERSQRFPYCRQCAWNEQHPEEWAKILPMVQGVSQLFQDSVPDRYQVQSEYCQRTEPAFIIPGTVFTTLTLNKNFRTACHLDAGDLESGFSCLSVIRRGKFTGGILVLPEWKIAAKLDTQDVIFFQAHEWHGNTEIQKITKNAVRCSIVYYFREKMIHCQSPQVELEIAKRRQKGQNLFEQPAPDIHTQQEPTPIDHTEDPASQRDSCDGSRRKRGSSWLSKFFS